MGKRGRPPHPDILTPREWQVLALLRHGLTNEQIAQRLDISYATAKYHVAEIISKLGVQTREEAAAWQPVAAPVRWWQRAIAWVPRRAWPLAGAVGALAALAALTWLVLGVTAGDNDDTVVNQPQASPSTAASVITSPTPIPAVTPIPGTAKPSGNGIYVIRPDGTDLRLVKAGVYFSAPSPTDNRLALVNFCEAPTTLTTVDADSGDEAVLAVFDGIGYSPEWSPDGRYILLPVLSDANPRTPAVYLIDSTGSDEPVELFTGSASEWSPNGKEIAFVAGSESEGTLRITDVPETTFRDLDLGPSISDLVWSPDGGRLAYVWRPSAEGPAPQLVVIDRDGTGRTVVSENASPLRWSADGLSLYVVLTTGEQNAPFAIVPAEGGISPTVLARGSAEVGSDDKAVAVYRFIGQQDREIVVIDRADGSERVVSGVVDPVDTAHFSPDGNAITFGGEERDKRVPGTTSLNGWNVYAVATDGSNLRRLLAPDVNVANRGWSRDTRWVIFYVGPFTGCEQPYGP